MAETRVIYKAIADFSALTRAAAQARSALAALKAEEKDYNQSAVAGAVKATAARRAAAASLNTEARGLEHATTRMVAYTAATTAGTAATQAFADAVQKANAALPGMAEGLAAAAAARRADTLASKEAAEAQRELASAATEANRATTGNADRRPTPGTTAPGAAEGVREVAAAANQASNALDRAADSARETADAVDDVTDSAEALGSGGGGVGGFRRFAAAADGARRSMDRLNNWKPDIVPPFIALIPLIAGVIAGLNPLVSLLGAAGAAVLGLASNLGSLAGAAIAVVPAMAALIGAIAGVTVATRGIGGAFQAFGAAQKAQAAPAGGGGGGGQSEEDRLWAIESAQRSLTRAHRSAAEAQKNLNRARQQALRDLENLRREVSRNALDEKEAVLAVTQAREQYLKTVYDPRYTDTERLEAQIAVERAEANLADTRSENARQAEDLAEAERKGVEGSDQVVAARQALDDATWSVTEAERNLQKAMEGTAGAGGAVSAAASAAAAYEAALAKLSPSARRFVETLVAMQDAWKATQRVVQEAFFGEFVDDLGALRALLPSVESYLSDTAGAMGRLVSGLLQMLQTDRWLRDIETLGARSGFFIDTIGAAVLTMLDAFRDVAIVAGPFLQSLAEGAREGAVNFALLVGTARETGRLGSWLETVRARLSQWWTIVKNIGRTLFNYGAAAGEFGQWITDGLARMTAEWARASEEARGPNSPFRAWLEEAKPVLTELRLIAAGFFRWFAEETADPENLRQIQEILYDIRTELGPAIGRLLETLTNSRIAPQLVDSFTALADGVSRLIESGGGTAFQAFFATFNGLIELLTALMGIPGVGQLLGVVAAGFGTIAAVSLIGKWTGITAFVGWLIELGQAGTLTKILDAVKGTFTRVTSQGISGFVDGLNSIPETAGRGERALAGLTKALSVVAVAAVAAELAQLGATSMVAKTSVDDLADSLRSLGRGAGGAGELGELFAVGAGPFRREAKDAQEVLDRFASSAREALGADFWDQVDRSLDFGGAEMAKFKEQALQLDGALEQMVTSGNADEAAAAWERLAAAAVAQGVPLEDLEALFPRFNAAMDDFATYSSDAAIAQQDLRSAIEGSAGDFASLGGALDTLNQKNRDYAQSTADSTADASDSWETYYDGFSVNLGEYLAELEAQKGAQDRWVQNLAKLKELGLSDAMIADLARLGPEGAPLVEALVTGSAEHLAEFKRLFGATGDESVQAMIDAILYKKPVLEIVAAASGQATADRFGEALDAGRVTIAQIMDLYGITLRNNEPEVTVDTTPATSEINTLIEGTSKREITIGVKIAPKYSAENIPGTPEWYRSRGIPVPGEQARAVVPGYQPQSKPNTTRKFGYADGGVLEFFARGGLKGVAREKHTAQISRNSVRVWAEPETGGEAYIPLAQSKRPRSVSILNQVASMFGMATVPTGKTVTGLAFGGLMPTIPSAGYGSAPGFSPGSWAGAQGGSGSAGLSVDTLVVNNPVGETTEESIVRTSRKLAYLNGWGG